MDPRPPSWLLAALLIAACTGPKTPNAAPAPIPAAPATAPPPATVMAHPDTPPPSATVPTELATFGSGCFWCSEAVLERLDGVLDVVSGYCGGRVEHPTYEQVCSGTTGHAEVVQVTFDPKRISYETLLGWFFKLHDPTTLNRQGPDEGTQYRSAIFFHSPEQREKALAVIRETQSKFHDPIVTEVTAASTFWPAEDYHQDYFQKNPNNRYCRAMIPSKLKKLGLDGIVKPR